MFFYIRRFGIENELIQLSNLTPGQISHSLGHSAVPVCMVRTTTRRTTLCQYYIGRTVVWLHSAAVVGRFDDLRSCPVRKTFAYDNNVIANRTRISRETRPKCSFLISLYRYKTSRSALPGTPEAIGDIYLFSVVVFNQNSNKV